MAAALCILSCEKQIEETDITASSNSGTATFTFTPSILAEALSSGATKSMADLPKIHNLYFAVFDDAGYKLNEYAQAIPNTYADKNWDPSDPSTVFQYSVTLTVTDQPRILHILANAPEHMIYGSEAEVIGSLFTRYDASETEGDWSDTYWVRIYLENGVWPKPDESTRDTDPKFQDKYDKWNHVVNTLNEAKLIRNFGRIIVDGEAAKTKEKSFELTRYWLTNIPDIGSFAPYNRNTGKFQIDFNQYSNIYDLSAPDKGNYPAFYPASANLIKIGDYLDDDDMLSRLESDASKNWTSFFYEREMPKESPVTLIIAGKYDGDSEESFYKIDIRDQDGDYFPLMRNFTYLVKINEVSTKGASTLAQALSSAPSGDVDTALEMQDLTNISNGTAQIFVSETSGVLIGKSHDVTLRYKFVPSLTTDANHDGFADAVNTVLVAGSPEEAAAIANHDSYVTVSSSFGSTGKVFESITPQAGNDPDSYSNIKLTTIDAAEIIHTEIVTITGHYWDSKKSEYKTLSRTVNYKLREALQMQLAFSPAKIPAGYNQPVDLVISLEAGLPSSMFSLDFDMEMMGLTLTTNNDPLPVSSGESQIAGNSKPAYQFRRTITWTEYDNAPMVNGYKQFVCHFKTNTSSIPALSGMQTLYGNTGGTGTLPEGKYGDFVNVQNSYFVQKNAYYQTYAPRTFNNINIEGAQKVGEVGTLTFDMGTSFPDGASYSVVTVGLKGFEPADLDTYELKGVKDGYELYELTVYSTEKDGVAAYTGKLPVMPYLAGDCDVRLYADEYTTADKSFKVLEGIRTYVNADGTGRGTRMVQAQGVAVAPAGAVVVGQKATLTVYLADVAATSTVKFGSESATRGTDATAITADNGTKYYPYTVENYTSSTAGRIGLNVTVDGILATRIFVPVYGISETAISSVSQIPSDTWCVVKKDGTTTHVNNNGTNRLNGANGNVNYYSLFSFSGTSAATIKVPTDSGMRYITGTNRNDTLGLNATTGATYNVIANNGSFRIVPSNNTSRGWRQDGNTANLTISSTIDNFKIYSVQLVAPAE